MIRKEGKMTKRNEPTMKDFELLPDPVWIVDNSHIEPAPFFLKWWQKAAERRFGAKERWPDIAYELGYVAKVHDPESGKVYMEPVAFGYDAALYRTSLGIPHDMPLVSESEAGNLKAYRRLWDWLLLEEKEAMSGQ